LQRGAVAALVFAVAALAPLGTQATSCEDIEHSNSTTPLWEIDTFEDAETGEPLVVTFEIWNIANDTVVEVFNQGNWVRITVPSTVPGVATRFTLGGSVHIAYSLGGCGEEIQPHH